MTIHHFYLFAGCLLWLCLLGYCCAKLIGIAAGRRKLRRQKQQIDHFFDISHTSRYRAQHVRILQGYLSSNLLFDYIFTCYNSRKDQFEASDRDTLDQCMESLVNCKIKMLAPNDVITRNLVLFHIIQSGLMSAPIQAFLSDKQNTASAQAFSVIVLQKVRTYQGNEVA